MKKDKKSSGKLSWKIVTGVLILSLASGSGLAVYRNGNSSSEDGGKVVSSPKASNGKSKLSDKELKQIETLKKVDTDYIEKVCTYFDETKSLNDISDKELQDIYEQALNYYCTVEQYRSKYGYYSDFGDFDLDPCIARVIIDSDQVNDQTDDEWSFKGSAFDKFNRIAGIDTESRNIDVNSDNVEYDGENYTVDFYENLESNVDCDMVSTLIPDAGELIVNLRKKETGANGKTYITKEHAVVVPADNDYGYKIKSIEDGYVKEAQLLEGMTGASQAWLISKTLDNYDSDQKVDKSTLKKIAQAGPDFARNNSINYEVDEGDYSFKRSMFDRMCTLAGISKEDASSIEIDDDDLSLNSMEYELKDVAGNVDYITSGLRSEIDYKNNEITYYYLMAKTVGQKVNKYVKKSIVLKPVNNVYGYKIKKITTEEWDDKYSDEIKEVEDKVEKLSDKQGTTVDKKYKKIEKQIADSWIDEMDSLTERIAKKYPGKKKEFEKKQEKYWTELIENLDETYPDDSDETKSWYKTVYARERCFYLIGNALMEDHMDEILAD